MRKLIVFGALAAACAIPSTARAQGGKGEVQGFGGLTVGTSSFGSALSPTFGARVAADLTPNLQVIGEGGRLADIKSPLFDLLDFTSVGVRVSALYGEGGVRFLAASPRSAVRPYGEATAGFARLNADLSGINGTAYELLETAMNVINSTRPMLGVGGGVVLQGGPLTVDVGYRYKKISAGNTVASLLNAGRDYKVNQVRVGVGFRF
jgi:opacity protein-like surface antigen